ncbi:hypothetical protein [Pseudomonas sp. UMAB-40]|uniref:hypothetical protein n=1 Tax=Pseudomonas sp. UMAB-40 TaxID=1365407 RepID=UPI001C58E327|nr:hypothetical protein [Pseudomonas sp. UMAB-40]
MNSFTFAKMRTQIEVIQSRHPVGFRVQVQVLPGSDESWEQLIHEELFSSSVNAERLLVAVSTRGTLNLDHWVWSASKASPFGQLQVAPTATLKKEFYTPAF